MARYEAVYSIVWDTPSSKYKISFPSTAWEDVYLDYKDFTVIAGPSSITNSAVLGKSDGGGGVRASESITLQWDKWDSYLTAITSYAILLSLIQDTVLSEAVAPGVVFEGRPDGGGVLALDTGAAQVVPLTANFSIGGGTFNDTTYTYTVPMGGDGFYEMSATAFVYFDPPAIVLTSDDYVTLSITTTSGNTDNTVTVAVPLEGTSVSINTASDLYGGNEITLTILNHNSVSGLQCSLDYTKTWLLLNQTALEIDQ